MIAVEGILQKEQGVIHIVARRFTDLTPDLMAAMTAPADVREIEFRRSAAAPAPHRHPRETRVLPKGRNFH